ncbi:MAG: flavin reductase family protein [Betaproteobacteria bacterium]|nr:flavin reductase family protein [Betaproteobacteria bacterium]
MHNSSDTFFDAASQGLRENYRLLIGSVVPRPIAWVSTLSEKAVANLAPYSFFTVASCEPPVLCVVQIAPRNAREKDTLRNLRATRECVVNIVSADLAARMNLCSGDYPPEVSEFDLAQLTQSPSRLVRVPGVAEARVRIECRLREVVLISSGPGGGALMLLDVLGFHVQSSLLESGAILPQALDAVGKMGDDAYAFTRDRFDLARPPSDRPLQG